MHDLPHHYRAEAAAMATGDVELTSPRLPAIRSAAPAEFGGPGDRWSPETLLVAAVADCFILSFRAIAAASGFTWTSLECAVVGDLDKVDGALRFTDLHVRATLAAPAGQSEDRARRLLDKAERSCLVTNSLTARLHFDAEVRTADDAT